jgi:hypothetical protein
MGRSAAPPQPVLRDLGRRVLVLRGEHPAAVLIGGAPASTLTVDRVGRAEGTV